MNCKNNFCIYWKDDQCILAENSLDGQGCCEDLIYVNIDEKILKPKRQELIKIYNDF